MSSSNCFFLNCIQISQEADQVVWHSHILKNFSQFVVLPTAKVFGIVNKAEVDIFMELSGFFYAPADVGNLISGYSLFSKSFSKSVSYYGQIKEFFKVVKILPDPLPQFSF